MPHTIPRVAGVLILCFTVFEPGFFAVVDSTANTIARCQFRES